MDNTIYVSQYKCRLCGEVFSDIEVEDITGLGVSLATQSLCFRESVDIKSGTAMRLMDHECKDGCYGLADFQGFRKVI